MDARREDATPQLKDLQIGYPWAPLTPVKPDLTIQQPISSNWQDNHTLNQTNWLEPGILTRVSQVTQPSWSTPGEFIADAPNQILSARYNSENSINGGFNTWQAGEASSSSPVYRDPLQSVGMWQASEQHNSNVYGADFVVDDKFTIDDGECWNNMYFGSLLALAHNNPPKVAPNAVMQADSAATNITFATHFRPHVAESQRTMSFGNSSVPNLDSFLGDNMCHILGEGSSTATRPFFDLNAPCTTITDDAALSKSISFQFEPITPYKTNKPEYKQDGPHIQNLSTNDKSPARDAQANTAREKKKQSVIDQLPRKVQENHKPDKGGNSEAELSKTPQQQKPRRRKHRPKVVIEGQTKTTPRPRGRPPLASQETSVKRKYIRRKATNSPFVGEENEYGSNIEASVSKNIPTEKRKSVRRKGINKAEYTMDKGSNKQTDLNTTRLTRSSCRRSLNFNMESQAENFNAKEGMEVMDKNLNDVDVPRDLTSSMKQAPEGYLSRPDKGKCKIVFSDVTFDKEENGVQLTVNPDKEWTPQNDYICSKLTEERERGLKRQHSEAEASSSNATGRFYNFMDKYLSILSQNACTSGMLFPTIYKKKRTEKVYGAATSSLRSIMSASDKQVKFERRAPSDSLAHLFTSRTNQGSSVVPKATNLLMDNPVADGTETGKQFFYDLLALRSTERVKRKRSKGCTRMRNFASLQELCKQLPAFPSEEVKASQTENRTGVLHEPNTCMEALVADTCAAVMTKKRSKRVLFVNTTVQNLFNHQELSSTSAGPTLALSWRRVSEIDLINDQLNLLDLNAEIREVSVQKQKALMPGRVNYEEKQALITYQKGGDIVAFDGLLEQFQRRRARPRVDLDEETTRVWKLLLEDINSEGVDGTDDEKTKWWEEERGVFKGRADSFIARMHLIQGDRRFSPWKGSVVDSVVGVFLTQNVSDHLSSSAFMSLAAHFPLGSKTSTEEFPEARLYTKPRQPEVCVLEADETTALNKKVLFEPVHSSGDSQMLHDFDDDKIRVDNLSSQLPDMTNSDPILSNESAPNKSTGLIGNGLDMDDALSSQISVISSQNSADSPDAQTNEVTESCSLSNSEKEPAATNSFASPTSFARLLQMAGTVLHGVYEKDGGNKESDENQSESLALKSQNENKFVEPISSGKDMSSCESTIEAGAKEASDREKIEMKQNLVEKYTGQVEAQTLLQESGQKKHLIDTTGSSSNVGNSRKPEIREVNSNKIDPDYRFGKTKRKGGRIGKGKQKPIDWDGLRRKAEEGAGKRERTAKTMDSVDWDAVRCAEVNEIAQTIKERGMNNMLAERIKDFLNRLVQDHGSIDLEWLRDVPPDKAKEYLLSIRGLGLKSVECVRLLTLHHLAFPVDTNVGRIAVRLGWVPLQPLPESLQLHLLEMYPVLESIQKYLWPRLCKLDQRTLYELHYQMITFGKVFCTKSKPNCNACPMRGECRHFASAFASARLALPAPEERSIVAAAENKTTDQDPMIGINTLQLPSPLPVHGAASQNPMIGINSLQFHSSQPIIEEPATPETIVELPEQEYMQVPECDIEDAFYEDPDEIPTIHFNMQQFTQNLQKVMQYTEMQEGDMSKALVALTPEAASIPVPKLKNVSRLRTEHQVYELSDSHPLLEGMDKREPDDPCPYLLAIWTPGETADSIEPPERRCGSPESGKLCTDETCLSCNGIREQNSQTVRGTILIPCRTAMRGSFPLNGTYFQVNEVFSDHGSSLNPIDVPREWLWNLPRRTVYFGTSIPTIFKGLTTAGIQYCFWRGFVCVRGFERKTREPRPLIARLHFPASKLARGKGKSDDN